MRARWCAIGVAMKLIKPLSELKIPPTVQAILAARIDRFPPEQKELLQTLSAIGKEFGLEPDSESDASARRGTEIGCWRIFSLLSSFTRSRLVGAQILIQACADS